MVDVSVIMPVYNVENHLRKSIESIIQQTHQNIELILVNDGSTDNSGKICGEYQTRDQKVRVFHQKNKGPGLARNAGIENANGKYIYFADPDDYLEQELIAQNVKIAEEKQSDIVIFGFVEERLTGSQKIETVKLPADLELYSKDQIREEFEKIYSFHPYALWNKLYKKEFLLSQDCFFSDQRVGQDALFNLMVYRSAARIVTNPAPFYHYVFREGSAINKYRPDRFEMEYTIADRFHALMTEWGKDSFYSCMIDKEYWNAFYLELVNLSMKDCPMRHAEKRKRLDSIAALKEISQMFKNLEGGQLSHPFNRWLLMCAKRKLFFLSLYSMKIRLSLEKKAQKVFYMLKRR